MKVFNLILWATKVRFLSQHESPDCKCRLHENLCNLQQKWNHD